MKPLYLIIYILGPILIGSLSDPTLGGGPLAKSTPPIKMTVGESLTRYIAGSANLNVSRKGIIDVQFIDTDLWQITALKEGLAIISTPGKSPDTRVFIHVTKSDTDQEELVDTFRTLCATSEFTCDFQLKRIEGRISNWGKYLWVRKQCSATKECDFRAVLADAARIGLERKMTRLLQFRYQVMVNQDGGTLIVVPCGERDLKILEGEINALLGSSFDSKIYSVICRDHFFKRSFRIRGKIFVVDGGSSIDVGSGKIENNGLLAQSNRMQLITDADFKALSKNRRIRIAGEPVLRVLEGSEATIESGGEFPVIVGRDQENGRTEAGWKQYGLTLKVRVTSEKDQSVILGVDFAVRSPGGNSHPDNLKLNRLTSILRAEVGKAMIIGGAEIETEGNSVQGIPLLSAIPIIGPLFRLTSSENAKSQLFLWLVLDDDGGQTDVRLGLPHAPGQAPL